MDLSVATSGTGSWFDSAEAINNAPLFAKIFIAYAAGFLTSLTPCVYPLIAITLGSLRTDQHTTRGRAMLLSLAYVFGIIVTFSSLGMLAAKSGAYFGAFLGNPWAIGGLFLFFVFLAAWTLEIFGAGFAGRVQSIAAKFQGRGFSGAFILGALSGFTAAPCAGPTLIGILGIAAVSGQSILGLSLLTAYAIGFGTLFLIIGFFSQALEVLPKSGDWLHIVKYIIAVVIFMASIFILRPLIHEELTLLSFEAKPVLCLTLLAFGILATGLAYETNRPIQRFLAAALLAFSLFQTLVPAAPLTSPLPWNKGIEAGLSAAKASGKTLMVDFFADWCGGCLEYDVKTFADVSVRKELLNFELAREDFTEANKRNDALSKKLGIQGLPTIIFFSPAGAEIPGARVIGFLEPKKFILRLKAAASSAIPTPSPSLIPGG